MSSTKQKLKVSFDDPEHAWVGMTIRQGEESINVIASYTPSDSFLDLTNAMIDLLHYQGEAIIVLTLFQSRREAITAGLAAHPFANGTGWIRV